MQGIKINDSIRRERGSFLSFDLKDILTAVGDSVLSSKWLCRDVECTGENAGRLHDISDEGRNISGGELMQVVSGIHQIIDGEFEAYDGEADKPWLVVSAVDSSWFEVWSSDTEILERVKNNFRDVSDLPPPAA